MSARKYQVFKRRWWKDDPNHPGKLIPGPGRKSVIGYAKDIEEARKMCQEYNNSNNPGKYGVKAEFTSDY